MTDWLPVVQTVGIPGAIILVGVGVLYKVIPWMGEHVILPIVGRIMKFFDKLEVRDEAMVSLFQKFGSDLKHVREHQENGDNCRLSEEMIRACERYIKSKEKEANGGG